MCLVTTSAFGRRLETQSGHLSAGTPTVGNVCAREAAPRRRTCRFTKPSSRPGRMPRIMSLIPDLRARVARTDPLVPLLCALATVVYVLHGFHGYLSRDLGTYAYGAEQVAEGVPPYVAVINRAGPLAHLIPGIGAVLSSWAGVDQVVGMRVFLMFFAVACIAVL